MRGNQHARSEARTARADGCQDVPALERLANQLHPARRHVHRTINNTHKHPPWHQRQRVSSKLSTKRHPRTHLGGCDLHAVEEELRRQAGVAQAAGGTHTMAVGTGHWAQCSWKSFQCRRRSCRLATTACCVEERGEPRLPAPVLRKGELQGGTARHRKCSAGLLWGHEQCAAAHGCSAAGPVEARASTCTSHGGKATTRSMHCCASSIQCKPRASAAPGAPTAGWRSAAASRATY